MRENVKIKTEEINKFSEIKRDVGRSLALLTDQESNARITGSKLSFKMPKRKIYPN